MVFQEPSKVNRNKGEKGTFHMLQALLKTVVHGRTIRAFFIDKSGL